MTNKNFKATIKFLQTLAVIMDKELKKVTMVYQENKNRSRHLVQQVRCHFGCLNPILKYLVLFSPTLLWVNFLGPCCPCQRLPDSPWPSPSYCGHLESELEIKRDVYVDQWAGGWVCFLSHSLSLFKSLSLSYSLFKEQNQTERNYEKKSIKIPKLKNTDRLILHPDIWFMAQMPHF